MRLLQGKCGARVTVETIDLDAAPAGLLDDLDARADPVCLDSAARHEHLGRYSILACEPLEVLRLDGEVLTDARGHALAADSRTLWPALAEAFACVRLDASAPGTAYLPGWIGYVGYEVGRRIEHLPGRAPRDTDLPDLRLGFYDALLVHDSLTGRWELVQLHFDRPVPGAGRGAEALETIARRAARRAEAGTEQAPEQADPVARPQMPATSDFAPDDYRQAVRRCVDYIAAGDIFQVNLSQRLTVTGVGDPLAAYHALRRRNPAWYAAYLRLDLARGRRWVLSSSPELFLRVRDGHVLTRPIKGTRPRRGDRQADQAAAAELVASEKDNAELAMIIDLLRNDLGRVCRYGTVRVTRARELEEHPTVFHLVGTVEGDLYDGVGPAELLRATFPGGSITGAPKIRAMEIIDEIEPVARGVYTGSIGIVGVGGDCEWNIAIRTIVCDGERALVQVGGGIVADSTPAGEYDETLDKARAMLEALAAVPTDAPRKQ